MNILIVGPGAIGSLWAIKLQQAGHQVSVFGRQTTSPYQIGLDGQGVFSFRNRDFSCVRQADLVLITVKSCQVAEALEPLKEQLHPGTILMLMHNGMGTLTAIGDCLPKHPVLLATTTHGAYKSLPTQLHHTGQGQTWIGAANEKGQQCRFLVDVMHHALPDVQWHDNIEHALWRKLAVNCVINPLTALHQCPNGHLSRPEFQAVKNALIAEVTAVMLAELIPVNQSELTAQIDHVIDATAENHSSMNRDIFHRRQTEIDFITGYLIQTARKHGIAIPENEALYRKIKAIENSRAV